MAITEAPNMGIPIHSDETMLEEAIDLSKKREAVDGTCVTVSPYPSSSSINILSDNNSDNDDSLSVNILVPPSLENIPDKKILGTNISGARNTRDSSDQNTPAKSHKQQESLLGTNVKTHPSNMRGTNQEIDHSSETGIPLTCITSTNIGIEDTTELHDTPALKNMEIANKSQVYDKYCELW